MSIEEQDFILWAGIFRVYRQNNYKDGWFELQQ